MEPFATRTNEKMKEVLMDPSAEAPAIHYYMIRGGKDKRNVTVWETGTVGGEYIKTYGHYHIIDFQEVYRIIEGEGILLIQMRKKDTEGTWIDDEIESFNAIKVKVGDEIAIPSFAGHALVNTGKTWLVTSDNSPVNLSGDSASMPAHADYEVIKHMHGMAYYVVEKESVPTFVKNERYKEVPPIKQTQYR
jgi:glucose-6-phosphate isomerase